MSGLVQRAERHEYAKLFLADLRWSAPDQPPMTRTHSTGKSLTVTNVSSYKGIRVWVCDERPGAELESWLDRELAKNSTDRLVIFHDDDNQVWRWPVRRPVGGSTRTRLTSHRHRSGDPNPKFEHRLNSITLPLGSAVDANSLLARLRLAFDVEAQNETKHASRLMSRMYEALERSYSNEYDATLRDHEISVTMARILFLMFGDDTGMWGPDTFRELIHKDVATNGSDLNEILAGLFDHLDTPPELRSVEKSVFGLFPYVNGGIFSERYSLPTTGEGFKTAILDACAVDWSTISPAIFGSMFQSVRDAKTRHEMGEHYTSEENILRTLRPLFLDDLNQRFDAALKRDTPLKRRNALRSLHDHLSDIRFMDPACGCGNFIIVAYRELRDLELRIMEAQRDIELGERGEIQQRFDPTLELRVTLDHFYGIELDEWPARIAETAMFLIDRQCDLKLEERFGEAPERLPIQQEARITVGNALSLDWLQVGPPPSGDGVIIAGNPPFVAMHKMSVVQQNDRNTVFALLPESKGQRTGRLDYVASWFAKAIDYARGTMARVAFVATNSLAQGDSARALDPILREAGFLITFAHRSFKWTSDTTLGAAVVRCTIIGFISAPYAPTLRRLFQYPDATGPAVEQGARRLNFYLLDTEFAGPVKRTVPLIADLPRMQKGSQPTDERNLLVTAEQLPAVMADPIAAKYVKPFAQSGAVLDNEERWCLWLVESTASDRSSSRVLRDRLESVAAVRRASRTPSVQKAASTPWLFTQRRQPTKSWLGIPRHSSENRICVPMREFSPEVIAGDALSYIESCPDWLFVYLQSAAFTEWVRTFSGALESRFRISPDLTYNVFPFAHPFGSTLAAFDDVASRLRSVRSLYPNKTLAMLYDTSVMPGDLREVHAEMDELVSAVFGLNGATPAELAVALLGAHHRAAINIGRAPGRG